MESTIRPTERIQRLNLPPFDFIHERIEELRNSGEAVIDLSQGIPQFPPDEIIIETVRAIIRDRSIYGYSPGSGLLSLRQVLAEVLLSSNKVRLDPGTEILITAGANQAFLLALLTIISPGDLVLLPSPYFIGHALAVQCAGGVPVEVPLSEENGFQVSADRFAPYLSGHPRLLVLVSPNNPTGAVYDSIEIQKIILAAAENGTVVITDESYQPYVYGNKRHFSPLSVDTLRPHVLTVGSFSKSFNLAGWRVGYLLGPRDFIKEALKVQEPMIICPPVISQRIAVRMLQEFGLAIPEYVLEMGRRRAIVKKEIRQMDSLEWVPTEGAYFAFIKANSGIDSGELCISILEEAHVAVTTGKTFGSMGDKFFRLSYGSASVEDLQVACDRMRLFLADTQKSG